MRLICIPEKNWRPDPVRLFAPGTYRIPIDMDEETADRAIAEGAAVEVEVAKPAVEVAKPPKLETKPAAPSVTKPAHGKTAAKPTRRK